MESDEKQDYDDSGFVFLGFVLLFFIVVVVLSVIGFFFHYFGLV